MKRLMPRYLWAACNVGLGRSYGHTGDDTQDCIRFQVAKLKEVYPDVDFSSEHKVLHLVGETVLSLNNMKALVRLGVGTEVNQPAERGIYEVQGWKGNRGHAFTLIRRRDDSLWIMDFTTGTTDGLRPIEWDTVVRKWSLLMVVKLRS